MSEHAPRTLDVRVGSSTDALTPVSAAERPLGARAAQWLELAAVALAAVAADQLTKLIVSTQLDLDESLHVIGPFSIHHVQNSGIAFGLFASATVAVTALTAVRGRLDAALLRPLGRAPPGAAGGARPADRRLDVEPDRPGPPRPRDRLPRPALVAGVQPGRLVHRHRRRDPVRHAAPRRDLSPVQLLTARSLVVPAEAAGERLDRFLASLPELGSRAAAERLIDGGGALRRGRAAGQEPPAGRRGADRARAAGAALERARPRGRAACGSPTRTSTCWSWTSRPAWSSTRRPGTRAARSCTGSPGLLGGGDAPERPGIVHRLDRDTSGLLVVSRTEDAYRRPAQPRPPARAGAPLQGARPGASALVARQDRGADRPRPAASRPASRSRPTRRATRSRISRSTGCSTATPCSTSGSRRGGRTRSASTSPRSTCRSSAIRVYGVPEPELGASSSTPAPRVSAPADGRAGRGRVAAPARASGGAGPFRRVEPLVGEPEEPVGVVGLVGIVRGYRR